MIEMLTDIIGRNKKGEICHPYKYKRGQYAGAYVYILENNAQYQRADETALCNLILEGYFQNGGRIRMVAKDAKTTKFASALRMVSYKKSSI